MFEVLVMPSSV